MPGCRCAACVARLEEVAAKFIMAAADNSDENARAESFFKTLKDKEVHLQQYRTFADAEANPARFIDDVYNAKRLHSGLGYASPSEFEAAWHFVTGPHPLGEPCGARYFGPDDEPI